MHDTDFDALLTRTLGGYADGGVVPIDAMAIASGAAVAGTRRGLVPGFAGLPRIWRVAIVVVLTITALIAVAVIGSQTNRLIQPPAAHNIVVTTGTSTGCPLPGGGTTFPYRPAAIDLDSGTTRPLAPECVSNILLSPDGVHAAGVTGQQLMVNDLRTGTSTVLAGAGGSDLEAIQWSPKGTYLYWVGDNSAGRPTTIFVSSIGDARRSPLPTGTQGGYGNVTWSLDESRLLMLVPDGQGYLLGSGDGTGFRPLTDVGQRWLAMSPDGRSFAFARDRSNAAGQLVATDLLVGDGFSPPSPVTSFTDGGITRAAAWLPDGSALAAVVTHQRPEIATLEGAIELELFDPARVNVLRRFQLPAIGAAFDQPIYDMKASPDARYMAVSRHTITRDAQGLETHRESFVIVRLADGAILPTPSQRPLELTEGDGWTKAQLADLFFSPDSRRVVYHVPFSFQVVDLDGVGYRHIPLADVAPVGWGNQLVWTP